MVYDLVKGPLEAEFSIDELAKLVPFAQLLPEPPDMEAFRQAMAADAMKRAADLENSNRSKAEIK